MKLSITYILLFSILLSCKEREISEKNSHKVIDICKGLTIDSIPIKNHISIASDNGSVYHFISDDKITQCILKKYGKEGIKENYVKQKDSLDTNSLILYFTLFGITKDSSMLPELDSYISLFDNKDLSITVDTRCPYYYAQRSMYEIKGIEKRDNFYYETKSSKFKYTY